jgi:hypothetical protein
MKIKSQTCGNVYFEKNSVTSTTKDGYPKQSAEYTPSSSKSLSSQPVETMADLQSYSMMEERYGIREEGIF